LDPFRHHSISGFYVFYRFRFKYIFPVMDVKLFFSQFFIRAFSEENRISADFHDKDCRPVEIA